MFLDMGKLGQVHTTHSEDALYGREKDGPVELRRMKDDGSVMLWLGSWHLIWSPEYKTAKVG